jgi:hypothetical protein
MTNWTNDKLTHVSHAGYFDRFIYANCHPTTLDSAGWTSRQNFCGLRNMFYANTLPYSMRREMGHLSA